MKTRTIVSTVAVLVLSSIMLLAGPVDPKVVVINQKGSGTFKVIYEGEQKGDVNVAIYSKDGKQVFAETIKQVDGFIRPLNFSGMTPGEYTIQITDKAGKAIQTVNYLTETAVNKVHVAKISGDDKYLLSVPGETQGEINVKIYDGLNNLVHNQNIVVDKDYGLVYNLKQVVGVPTFEVTDKTGNVKTIK